MKLTIFLVTCMIFINMPTIEGKTFLIETKDEEPTSAVTEDNVIDNVDAVTEEAATTVDEVDDLDDLVNTGKYGYVPNTQ